MAVTADEVDALVGGESAPSQGVTEADVAALLGEQPAEPPQTIDFQPSQPLDFSPPGESGQLRPAPLHLGKPGQVVSVDPDTYKLTPDQADRAARIGTLFRQSWATDADRNGAMQRFAKSSGLKFDVVRENFDELKQSWESSRFDPVKWMRQNEHLARLVLDHPELGATVERDQPISVLHQALNFALDHDPIRFLENHPDIQTPEELRSAFAADIAERNRPRKTVFQQDETSKEMQGGYSVFGGGLAVPNRFIVPFKRFGEMWAQMSISKMQYELMLRKDLGQDTFDLENRLQDARLSAVQRDYNEGPIEQVFTDVSQAAASSLQPMVTTAAPLAAAGAVAVGAGTLAATKSPAAAGRAALSAASFFGKSGAVYGTFQFESGSAYGDMLDHGLDERTAATAAKVYGTLAAGIEFASWGPMFKSLGPVGALAKEGSTEAFTKALLQSQGFKATLKNLAGEGLAEGGEEFLQDATQQAVEYFARAHQVGFDKASTDYPGVDLGQSLEAGVKGTVGGLGLGVAHAGIGMTTRAMFQDRARESKSTVDLLAGFSGSSTALADPEAVAEMIGHANPGLKSLFVAPEAFVKLYQDAKVDPSTAAQEVLGESGPRLLQEALATGQKLEVPLAAYIDWGQGPKSKVATLAHKQALAAQTTTDAALPVPALIDAKEIRAQAEALAEQFSKGENAEPETAGEAAFLDAAEKQLATVTGDGVEARAKMQLLRAFARVQSERFGQDPNQVFKDMTVLVEAGRVPTAQEVLFARAQDLSLDRAEELYRDQNTGLPNELAFKESTKPANRPKVAHLSVEGIKWLNDNVSHDRADLLYRAVAQALHSVGQDAFKVGGDFVFYTKGDEGAAGVLEKVRAALPEQLRGFALTMATGNTLKEAAYKNAAETKRQVAAGTRANPRPVMLDQAGEEQVLAAEKPKGLGAVEATDLQFPAEKAAPALSSELRERAKKLAAIDYYNKAYVDPVTGEWTAKGWAALPRKQHVVSIDLAGLRKVNENFGEQYGDQMLRRMGLFAQELGGEAFDFAHLHGDEYAAQSDDLKALEAFVENVRSILAEYPIEFTEPETGELTPLPIDFHHGFGERSLEAADADLNDRKRRLKKARQAGLERRRGQSPRPVGDAGTGPGSNQAGNPQADRAAAARRDDYPEARALIARARSNKGAYESWFRWCVELKGKGERPSVSWAVESTMARYGVVDPVNGFSGDESGRDMSARTIKGDKSKGGDLAARQARAAGIGLVGNAADAHAKKHTTPASRRFFQPAGPETLLYQFPTPEEAGQKLHSGARGYTQIFNEGMQRIYKVVLNPSADHSTFLHESAHVFLDMLTELAQRPDAPAKVKEDYAAVLTWLGAKGPADLEVKSASENDPARQRHEKWARAFERYLFEGHSPARKLVRMFERFRLWLSRIYRDPRVLGAPLSDDIRRVFDRMLATDREIENYQRAMGLEGPPLARDVLGMTAEQYQDYLDERVELTSTVTRRLDHSAAQDQLREQEAWWKDETRKERERADEEYEKLPARIAQQTLAGKGELAGPEGPLFLAREDVVEAVGDKAAKKFRTTTKEAEKVSPDEVAEFLGYPTGKAMLDGVLALPGKDAWVKQAADARMNEKHPDVVKDLARLREQVGKGWHGEATERYFLREWAALRLKASQTGSSVWAAQTAPIEVVQAAARETVANRTVGRLEVGQALAAEKRSADACLRAAAQGNFAKAFAMKQQQLLNFYVWRELSQAREERDAFVELAAELSKKAARERLGKASPVYRNAVDTMLEVLGLREPVPGNPGAGIDDVVRQMELDGQVIGIDQQALQNLEVKPKGWKDLTVGEMRVVRDALSSIKAAARGVTTVLLDGKRIEKDEAVQRIVDEGSRLPPMPPGNDQGAETWGEWFGGWWNAADGAMLKNETMLHWLGGNDVHSAIFRLLGLPIQAAKHAEVDLLRGPIKSIVKAFDAMPRSVRSRASELIDGKALFPGHTDRIAAPKRRWQVLMLLLNSGNASNLDRVTEGRDITEQQIRDAAVKVGITKEEYDWIQSVWDACESLKKPAFDLEERDTGIRPEEIRARAFETPFGTYKGGYFPAVYDRRGETGVGEKQRLQDFMDPTFTPIGTARGHLKSRVEGFSDIVSLSPSAIYRHLSQVAHDIAFREAVRSVGQLVTDDRVVRMLRQRLGEGRADTFVQYVKDVGRMRGIEGDAQVRPFLALMQGLRGAMAMAALGGSTPNVLEDAVTGLTTAVLGSELKAKHLAAGIAAVRGYSTKAMAEAESQSGELRSRHGQLSRELLSQLDQLISKSPLARGPLRFIKDHAFAQQEIVDRSVSAAIWIAAKRQATEEGESPADAVVFADKIVRQLLPSQHVVDTAALLRNKGFIGASLLFFRFWSTAYNTLRRNGPEVLPEFSMHGAKNTGMAMGYVFAFSILGSLARGQGPDPGEPWDQWFLRKSLTGFAGLFPWAGDLAEMAFADWSDAKKREPRNNSIAGMLTSIYQLAKKAGDGDKGADQRLRAAIKALGLAGGVPVGQPLRTGGYLYDLAAGNVEARGPGDVVGGLLYGQTEHQPANIPTLLQDLAQ